MATHKKEERSLLDRADLELLNQISIWADRRFGNAATVRDLYSSDHRPKVECAVLLALIRAAKDVKDFYTLP